MSQLNPASDSTPNLAINTKSSLDQTNPLWIRQKQKLILIYKFLGTTLLVLIPIAINILNNFNRESWETPLVVGTLGILALILYRNQLRLKFQIESACHQLGPGVKLKRKYTSKQPELYQIFQEGHRYYHLKSLASGEKRLVSKDKVLQDYDFVS